MFATKTSVQVITTGNGKVVAHLLAVFDLLNATSGK